MESLAPHYGIQRIVLQVFSMKKQFYFVRHGQTDHNIGKLNPLSEHTDEIPLNETGRGQARAIEPLIATLPIDVICASPAKRVLETKEIITKRISAPHYEIESLGECSKDVWQEMSKKGMYSSVPQEGAVNLFVEQVKRGLLEVLEFPGTPLVVAHGGVHWALCSLMGIEEHSWAIQNCSVVYFFTLDGEKWEAKIL